jgi:hypothetical protein
MGHDEGHLICAKQYLTYSASFDLEMKIATFVAIDVLAAITQNQYL